MFPLDPHALAAFQLASDRRATHGDAWLFAHKLGRMAPSPLAFLRGAAPLFYHVLEARPELAKGPPGRGWIVGDMHLENFGAYRPVRAAARDRGLSPEPAVFNLNDFDDAIVGPFSFDVLRLTTSLILGGRELGANGVEALELCELLLTSYVDALAGVVKHVPVAAPIKRLLSQVRNRARTRLLVGRTVGEGDARRFNLKDPARYQKLDAKTAKLVPAAFLAYVNSVDASERGDDPSRFDVLAVARRIAGTGSLGSLRIAVLVRGKGGPDGQWLFDLKEEGVPSSALLLGAPKLDPAVRVRTAARACLEHPARMLGTTTLLGRSLFGRRLAPQEDKLDLKDIAHADLKPLAKSLGSLLGKAHRHGATTLPAGAWSHAACEALVDKAITLAGVHEAVYLALCQEIRR